MKSILWLLSALMAFATASSAQTVTLTFALGQSTVTEGQGGAGVLVVRRTQGTEDSLRVFYRLSGNARNGVDYERLPGSVEIPAGSAEATIEIIPLDDNRREPTERVTVQLRPAPRNSPQYRLGGRRAQTIQILDDEQPSVPRPPPGVGRPPPWFPLPGLITNPTNATTTPTP